MNRAEHLQWSKDRAIEIAENGDLSEAFASFMNDMSKHPELENHKALEIGTFLLIVGCLSTEIQMINWIQGFN